MADFTIDREAQAFLDWLWAVARHNPGTSAMGMLSPFMREVLGRWLSHGNREGTHTVALSNER